MPDSTRPDPCRRGPAGFAVAVLVAAMLLGLLGGPGCGGQSEYKRIVERYVDSMPDRARRIYTDLPTEVLQRMVRHDAQLACTVDRDRGRSTPEAPSPSCRCYDGADFIAACAAWFQLR